MKIHPAVVINSISILLIQQKVIMNLEYVGRSDYQ